MCNVTENLHRIASEKVSHLHRSRENIYTSGSNIKISYHKNLSPSFSLSLSLVDSIQIAKLNLKPFEKLGTFSLIKVRGNFCKIN